MVSLTISPNDAPKLYFSFVDIYGDALSIDVNDLESRTYTVVRVVNGQQYPVEGFRDVVIPDYCWHNPAVSLPSNIQGMSAGGTYTLELFPYKNVSGIWVSPFSVPNSTYYVFVNVTYHMTDDALGAGVEASLTKTVAVKVTTGTV